MRVDRSALVRRIEDHLERRGRPRVELFLLVALSGLVGFIVSFALLTAGVWSMPLRYGIAASSAYLAFLCLLGAYVHWKRGLGDLGDPDALELVQFLDPSASAVEGVRFFEGGRSGGGGASASWEDARTSSSESGSWLDGDLDLGWILIALLALAAGLVAIGYVVWLAPALLAEVLVDAVIVSTVSRHVGLIERRDWTTTALRRTWLPALVIIVSLVIGGWALQKAAPEARSIGPALRELVEPES